MNKGLKFGWLLAAPLAAACVCALSLAMAGGNTASESTKSVTVKSSQVKSATKASDNDLAGRRYRRYVRRHTV